MPSRVKGRPYLIRRLRGLLIAVRRFSEHRAATPADTWWAARMVGRQASATSGIELVLAGKIRSVLAESPGLSGNAIAKHVRTNRQAVTEALLRMQQQGEVDSYTSGKRGGGTAWMLTTVTTQ